MRVKHDERRRRYRIKLLTGIVMMLGVGLRIAYEYYPPFRGWVTLLIWRPNQRLVCDGDLKLTLRGRTLRTRGTSVSILARDYCELTLQECVIDGRMPLSIEGHAHVTIEGGTITAHRGGIFLRKDASLLLDKVKLTQRSPGAYKMLSLSQQAIVVTRGVTIEGRQPLVGISGDARADLGDTRLQMRRYIHTAALQLRDRAQVLLDAGAVSSPAKAISLRGSAQLLLKGTRIAGRIVVDSPNAHVRQLQDRAQLDKARAKLRRRGSAPARVAN